MIKIRILFLCFIAAGWLIPVTLLAQCDRFSVYGFSDNIEIAIPRMGALYPKVYYDVKQQRIKIVLGKHAFEYDYRRATNPLGYTEYMLTINAVKKPFVSVVATPLHAIPITLPEKLAKEGVEKATDKLIGYQEKLTDDCDILVAFSLKEHYYDPFPQFYVREKGNNDPESWYSIYEINYEASKFPLGLWIVRDPELPYPFLFFISSESARGYKGFQIDFSTCMPINPGSY